jgi:GGDEF domain-containing protein
MGGDEFCVTAGLAGEDAEAIAARAAAALSDEGEGYRITCSHGLARLPADTADPDRALLLADRRMYADKAAGRPAPSYGMTEPPWRADLQTPSPPLPPAGSRTSPTR